MKVLTAIEELSDIDEFENSVKCFLAGGIMNCPDWQKDVISELEKEPGLDNLVLFNPRRENFPIHDPNASQEQITWEFLHLQIMDLFSMFFCSGESDQPICMYELGRNLLAMHVRFPHDWQKRLIISSETGYRRKNDVVIQTGLVCDQDFNPVVVMDDYDQLVKSHAKRIAEAYRLLVE